MPGILLLILISSPLLFQMVFGGKAIDARIKLKFGAVCLISLVLQIVFSILSFSIISDDFQKNLEENGSRCGMQLVGIVIISLLFTFLLVVAIAVQYLSRKSYKKSLEKVNGN